MEEGDDAMAMLAMHTFAKCVEAGGSDDAPFLEQAWCVPALTSVLSRPSYECKRGAAIAICVLVKHVGEWAAIHLLFQLWPDIEDEPPEGNPAGRAFARAFISAVAVEHGSTDGLTKEAPIPFDWFPLTLWGRPPARLWRKSARELLRKAANVGPAAEILATEGVGSMH
jgi:hypothetical protein